MKLELAQIEARLKLDGYEQEKIDKFFVWHGKRKQLWRAYQIKAIELYNMGRSRISSKAIFEKLREDPAMARIGQFRANNTFTSMWARVLTYKFPKFIGKIEFKPVGRNIKEAA